MDLFEDSRPGENTPEFTVSEISGAVKKVIEGEFGRVRVRGEVGRVFVARSGHLYFDIKDDRHVLASVSWKGQVSSLTARPEEGMEVIATGRLTTFGSQSKYQLNVEDLVPAGEGALMAMLEKRKKMLAAEGLFDESRKKPIPMLPDIIGVVTSPSGAVIRDILHRLRERFPRKVLVWPVAVQGPPCAAQVAAAIDGFNRLTPGGALPRPDLIIVARGGGSIEDLWGFNEEVVARAVAASRIPLISAVGHETDTTLIDYVSDKRAPTPTAAAEMAVPVRMELLAWSDNMGARMVRAMSQAVERRGQRLRDLARVMPRADDLTGPRRQHLDMLEARLPALLTSGLATRRHRLAERAGVLRPALLRDRWAGARQRVDMAARGLTPPLIRRQADTQTRLAQVAQNLRVALKQGVMEKRNGFERSAGRLDPRAGQTRVTQGRERLAVLQKQMDGAFTRHVHTAKQQVAALDRMRSTLGYEETLKRGYAVVRTGDQVVTTARDAQQAAALEIQFADGRITVGNRPNKKTKPDTPEQGSLF